MDDVIGKLNSKIVIVHPHTECKSMQDLMDHLDKVVANGGEGMMIKDPNS